MSVILDALNKSNAEASGGGVFKPASGGGKPPRKPDKTRVIILSVAAVLGIAVMIFYNVRQKTIAEKTAVLVAPIRPIAKPAAAPTLQATPAEIDSMRQIATDAMNAGKIKESLEAFDKLTKLAPNDAEALNNFGMALRRSGELVRARTAYESALALKPDYAEALNNLAVLDIQSGDFVTAKERLAKAVAQDPQFVGAILNLAVCEENLGDLTAAQDHYKAFLTQSRGLVDRRIRLAVEDKLSRFRHDAAENGPGTP